jgi:hypothetical protein
MPEITKLRSFAFLVPTVLAVGPVYASDLDALVGSPRSGC